MMIYMILITKLTDLLMLDAIFFQGVAFTFSFDQYKTKRVQRAVTAVNGTALERQRALAVIS